MQKMALSRGVSEMLLLHLTITDYQYRDQDHLTHRYDLAWLNRWLGPFKSLAYHAIELA